MKTPKMQDMSTPNYSSRNGTPILAIVNHIMEGTLAGTAAWFRNQSSRVSAHFGVGKRGELHQYVKTPFAAWHAGSVKSPKVDLPYPADIGPNLYTVGVEWEGRTGDVPTEEQYAAGLVLHQWLLAEVVEPRLPLRQRVIGHYQVNSVERPNCPGAGFPWERLYADLQSYEVGQGQLINIRYNDEFITVGRLIEGHAWAPVRSLGYGIGLSVSWDQPTMTVSLQSDTTLLRDALAQAEITAKLLKEVLNQ